MQIFELKIHRRSGRKLTASGANVWLRIQINSGGHQKLPPEFDQAKSQAFPILEFAAPAPA
jgi:hypothetical protein